MPVQKFENLVAWQKSQDLAVEIYFIFTNHKDFGFRDQVCRAAVSISNNIAEGFDRSSKMDFRKFLFYGISSCSELKSMVYLAEKLNYIHTEQKVNFLNRSDEVSKIIRGLIKSIK